MPRVSIVIPAYNPGGFLRPALDSVCSQTFTDWELVVIDDGSTEDVAAICEGVPNLRYVKRPHLGQSITRNAGIIESSGEFIAFLDHDDVWHPTKLQRQVEAMSCDEQIGLCYTNCQMIDKDGWPIQAPRHSDKAVRALTADVTVFAADGESYSALAALGVPTCTVAMVRRTAIARCGMFDPLLACCEDHDLWFKVSRHYKTAYLRTFEACYRQHPAQHTRTMLSMRNDEQVWCHYIKVAEETNNAALADAARRMKRLARRNFAALAYDRARYNWRDRRLVEAAKNLQKSLNLDPDFAVKSVCCWMLNRLNPARSIEMTV